MRALSIEQSAIRLWSFRMQIYNNRRAYYSLSSFFFVFANFVFAPAARCVFLVRLPASNASVKISFCIYYYYKAIRQVNNPHCTKWRMAHRIWISFSKTILIRRCVADAAAAVSLCCFRKIGRRLLAQLHISLETVSATERLFYKQQLLYLFHHFHINEISPLIFHNYAHYSYIGPSSNDAARV